MNVYIPGTVEERINQILGLIPRTPHTVERVLSRLNEYRKHALSVAAYPLPVEEKCKLIEAQRVCLLAQLEYELTRWNVIKDEPDTVASCDPADHADVREWLAVCLGLRPNSKHPPTPAATEGGAP